MSEEKKPGECTFASVKASVKAGPTRLRFIGKDGTVLTLEPWQELEFDLSNAPWTYMPETEQN